jgi:acyl-CoA synthetase (NDP forming)
VSPNKKKDIAEHISEAMESGKSILPLEESRKILELSGIPLNKSGLAKSEEEAVALAKEIGYPLVMKIVSPQIIHKTEVGGVRVNIDSEENVRKTFNEILENVHKLMPDADIYGILLEEMVSGIELIVGTSVDPQFGHMIMFGVGGIFVEVYKDVSFRLIPITKGDAGDMLNEIKGRPLLEGTRGLPRADSGQLVDILMKVSNLVNEHPNIREMDINPLVVTNRGAIAVDARIVLKTPDKPKTEGGLKDMIEHMKKIGYKPPQYEG